MNPQNETDIKEIIIRVRKVYEDYRLKNVWTAYQDWIGLGILLGTNILIVITGIFWFQGGLATWITIFVLAFLTSILHEIEHDIIHELYFKKSRIAQHLMFLGVYLFRPISLSPWLLKYWHPFHHQHSGMPFDIEERGITNGDRFSLLRLIVLPDLMLSGILRLPKLRKEIISEYEKGNLSASDVKYIQRTLFFGLLPLGVPLTLLWYAFAGLSTWNYFSPQPWAWEFLHFCLPIMVLLVIPNLIRQFCLHFISSNMHYNGDVEKGNVIQQVQVFIPWWSYPLQWFCFFFGATHAIHHFVVNEPFYLRQITRKDAQHILKKYGVRENDVENIAHRNRYFH